MNKVIKIFSILLLLGVLMACKKEGKPVYDEINDGSITGINKSYEVIFKGAPLSIHPMINWTQDQTDTGHYAYQWKAVSTAGNVSLVGTIISRQKNLDTVISISPGDYNLYFRATDTHTNVAWTATASLHVTTVIGRGFLVFGDNTEGYADLQMIAMPSTGGEVILKNLLANNGLPTLKGAVEAYYSGKPATNVVDNRKLWIMTKEGDIILTRLPLKLPPQILLAPWPIFPIRCRPRSFRPKCYPCL